MDTWIWLLLAVAAIVVVIGVAAFAMRASAAKRSEQLQGDFGPEYDRAVDDYGSRSDAEKALRGRKERVQKLKLRMLSAEQRTRFASSWSEAQSQFVDEPAQAVTYANKLVDEVMNARGYPVGDFDQRAEDISVDHPFVVQNYRAARDIARRNEEGEASTEDLRQAMVHYRGLFEELVNASADVPAIESGRDQAARPASGRA